MTEMPATTETGRTTPVVTKFQHHQGAHCETAATSNLLRYQGFDISEPMALGIGGGLAFGYFPFLRMAHLRLTTFRTVPGRVARTACRRMGLRLQRQKFWVHSRAQQRLDEELEQGRPVICQTSLYWLPYFPPGMRLHFNGHHIVVYGREDGRYLVSEPMMEEVVTLTPVELERARFARGGMNPNGRMYWLVEDPKPRSVDLTRPILAGIQEVCYRMLVPPIPFLGVRGIRFLGRDLLRWKRKLPEDQVREALSGIVFMQELVGSGGAGYRAMYAGFLTEAAEVLKSEELAQAARSMTVIVDQWRAFAVLATRFIRGRPNPGDTYTSMAEALKALAGEEEKLHRKLRDYAKRREASL
jgi:hypothetical protein